MYRVVHWKEDQMHFAPASTAAEAQRLTGVLEVHGVKCAAEKRLADGTWDVLAGLFDGAEVAA